MKLKLLMMLSIVVLATGCATAPKEPIPLSTAYYEKPGSIAIFRETIPEKAKMTMPGAACLLCMAAASVANADVSEHVETLSTEEMKAFTESLESLLEDKGAKVKFVDVSEEMERLPRFSHKKGERYAKEDYRALRKTVEADHLLVLDLSHVGVERTYANYVPTSSPQGAVTGRFYMVNLNTNEYHFYEPISVRTAVDGEWDEPPNFPGVTMAYFEAIERAKLQVREALAGKEPEKIAGKEL